MLHLTTFPRAEGAYLDDSGRSDWSGTWDEFCAYMKKAVVVEPPDPDAWKGSRVRALVPGRFLDDGLTQAANGRPSIANVNVLDTSFFVLDFDESTPEYLDDVMDQLRKRGLSFLLCPSFTGFRDPDHPKVHIYVPLAETCPGARHTDAYRAFAHAFGEHDVRCKNAARRFYYGQTRGPLVFERHDGKGLDWKALAPAPPSGAEIIQYACADPVPSKADVRKVLKRWERKGGEKGRAVAGRVKLMLAGQGYADKGERHTTNLQVTSWLAREYPRVDPGAFADRLAEPAWLDMYTAASDLRMARDRWVTMWQGQVAKIVDERKAAAEARMSAKAARIFAARYGRTAEPYSQDEIQAMADWVGVHVDLLPKYAVVQCGGLFWLLGLDRAGVPTYRGPRTGVDIVEAARDLLSPFGDLISVESFDETTGKPRLMRKAELMHQHGFTVEQTSGVFYGEPGLAIEQGTMRLRYARLEPAEGVWHQDVDDWLRLFAGGAYEALCDWLAVVTALDEAAPALWLIGPPGSGKSLLAMGVASLWGPHAAPVKGNALRNFNAELLGCPVVDFAETLGMSLDDFKEFVTCTEQRIEPKGVDKFPVSGALRIVLSSNHEHSLKTRRALTRADLGALADRMIVVRVCESAGRLNKGQAQAWLAGPFREHFTWLRENRQVEESDRLACRPYAAEVMDRLLDGNAPLGAAAELVVGQALGGDGLSWGPAEEPAVLYHARQGVVLLRVWDLVRRSKGAFNARSLAQALEPVGYQPSHKVRCRVEGASEVKRYAVVPVEGFRRLCALVDQEPDEILPAIPDGYDGDDEVPLPLVD